MGNKRIYEEKIKPLSSLFINYYGEEFSNKINNNFNNLIYNFDDIFTSSYDLLSNSPKMINGLIENYSHIKAKESYNILFYKYRDLIINRINKELGIDISSNYDLFFNYYFSTKVFKIIISDKNKLSLFSQTNNISIENIQSIYKIIYAYKKELYKELLKIDYFKDLYKRLNCNFNIYSTILNHIFGRDPFVARFRDINNNERNYLYYPYLNYVDAKLDNDVSLLHELVHLTESDETKNHELRIGLNSGNDNIFINEIRTDLLAIKLKDRLKENIFETRNINYNSLYLRVAKSYLYFFDKYEELLSRIAITGDLDRLIYYFTYNWQEFSKRMDELYNTTYKEYKVHEKGTPVIVNYNTEKIFNLINTMDIEASRKILIK